MYFIKVYLYKVDNGHSATAPITDTKAVKNIIHAA